MEFKGWGEALAENGWFVGHTTKGWGPGVATNAQGKPRLMTGKAFNAKKLTPPASGILNADYAANFGDFLDAAPAGKPWAFWYGAVEPHRPLPAGLRTLEVVHRFVWVSHRGPRAGGSSELPVEEGRVVGGEHVGDRGDEGDERPEHHQRVEAPHQHLAARQQEGDRQPHAQGRIDQRPEATQFDRSGSVSREKTRGRARTCA